MVAKGATPMAFSSILLHRTRAPKVKSKHPERRESGCVGRHCGQDERGFHCGGGTFETSGVRSLSRTDAQEPLLIGQEPERDACGGEPEGCTAQHVVEPMAIVVHAQNAHGERTGIGKQAQTIAVFGAHQLCSHHCRSRVS